MSKSMYRILNDIGEIVQEGITSYEEAWTAVQCSHGGADIYKYSIEEYVLPVTGLGRDPDLHTLKNSL